MIFGHVPCLCGKSDLRSYTFGNSDSYPNNQGVLHILDENGKEVTDLVLPDGVTSIGNYAFYGCTGLTSVVIGDSVTSIGVGAFGICTGLTSIEIPDSVTSIDFYAFYGCTGLTSITYNGTAEQWKAITKGSYWNTSVPATKVICSDGSVAIS